MQINLLDVTFGAELFLFFGYLLYGIIRTYPSKEDRLMISFYTAVLIGFITSILVANSILSLQRFLPGDIPLLFLLLTLDIIVFFGILGDLLRQKRSRNESDEKKVV